MQFFGGELPDEIKEAIRSQIDQQQMIISTSHHEIQRLFSELNAEHLQTLLGIFRYLVNASSSSPASYLEGLVISALHYRFEICGSCSRNHTEDLAQDLTKKPASNFNPSEFVLGKAKEYFVSSIGDKGKVKCNNCGIEYPSLADRMKRSPENCSGCHQKSAWG